LDQTKETAAGLSVTGDPTIRHEVMVVDDDRQSLRMLTLMLTSHGFRVRPVVKGKSAVVAARARPPDIILLDILMADMDGYAVCERLKGDPITKRIPIVFISALDETFDKVRALASGGVDYITKPFQHEEVLARVQTHLTVYDMQRRLEMQNIRLETEIQERKRTETALKESEEMRKQWLADISHELRTPLSILRGELEAVMDGVRDLNRNVVDSLYAEVARLTRLVEDMQLLSSAEAGELTFRFEPVFPEAILLEALGNHRSRFEKKGLRILFAQDELSPSILGDPFRLQQLFGNLLENTLRYTHAPGTLEIGFETTADRLRIRFEDSAPGVPDESLEHLFDRLYRVDKSRSRSLGGSGLGLSICRRIVEAHNGVIYAAHSSLGGVSIRVDFPLQ
jgi:signal transduction histidine kinase